MKGDWVITPTVGWNTLKIDNTSERDVFEINFPVVFYKYLSDRFAVGYGLEFNYGSIKPYVANILERNITVIHFVPEARYNFLKTRFTPFVSGKIIYVGYNRVFVYDPATPVILRTRNSFVLNEGLKIDVGVSYFIKDRFGLQVKLMDVGTWDFKDVNTNFYTPINFGLQFIINNPRSEIESPR